MTKPKKAIKPKAIVKPAKPLQVAIVEEAPGIVTARIHADEQTAAELLQHKDDPQGFFQKLFAWVSS